MNNSYHELIQHWKEATILASAGAVLGWDEKVMMPDGAQPIRSKQLSVLSGFQHKLATDEKIGNLLEEINEDELDEEEKANVREIKWSYQRAKKVPNELVKQITELQSKAGQVWEKAREEDDFETFKPYLEKMFKLKKEMAKAINPDKNPYQVLLEDYDHDLTIKDIEQYFNNIKEKLKPLIQKINEKQLVETDILEKEVSENVQKQFLKYLLKEIGYDFSKGRLDESTHPFTMPTPEGRITTRFEGNWLDPIRTTIHEAGHGMYNQGLPLEKFGTPIGEEPSLSIHESQSRLWENHIAKSKNFWKKYLPKLKEKYSLDSLTLPQMYKIINKVEPGLIRVDADELTYSMHVILRFEIEKAVLEEKLEVEDIPQVWNDKMEEYLGVRPPNDKEGVLQDTHWAWGQIGYFPTYTIGSMTAAQLFKAAKEDIQNLQEKIENGDFKPLRKWLSQNIWKHGSKYRTKEMVKRATQKELSSDDYTEYLTTKYKNLYDID